MSREIKFRAFDEQNLVMHNDFRFIKSGEEGSDWIVFTSDKQLLTDTPHPFDNPYFQQQLKVMQFTGLSDINGVEIYEGDIVDDKSGVQSGHCLSGVHEVKFYCGGFSPFAISGWECTFGAAGDKADCVVIGNIYQNPELLK